MVACKEGKGLATSAGLLTAANALVSILFTSAVAPAEVAIISAVRLIRICISCCTFVIERTVPSKCTIIRNDVVAHTTIDGAYRDDSRSL